MTQDPWPDLRTQRLVIGVIAAGLAAASIALIAIGCPWQLRFPVVAAAALFGPGIPLLRARQDLSLAECLVYGAGLDIGLLMLVGLALVMAHTWVPVAASVALFAASLAIGVKLTYGALR